MTRIMRINCLSLVLASLAVHASFVSAQDMEQVKVVFRGALPNAEGKSIVAVLVNYPPGAKSLPHHHAASSFIYAYVLSGNIRSKVDNEPIKTYKTGESFTESPGSYHGISENASATEPASLLAVFVVDNKDTVLTIPDTHNGH